MGCVAPEKTTVELSTVPVSTTEESYCEGLATTPNFRLWNDIDEMATVKTEVRQISDGSHRYCINVSIEGDPKVLGSSSCARTPERAIATFSHEFSSYLCGVTND